MFKIDEIQEVIQDNIINNMETAVKEIRKELSFPTYEGIVKSFDISLHEGNLSFSLELEKDYDTEGQDIVRVLAHGGAFKKKDGSFVFVPPCIALSRYLIQ